jgi:hypothetical protein
VFSNNHDWPDERDPCKRIKPLKKTLTFSGLNQNNHCVLVIWATGFQNLAWKSIVTHFDLVLGLSQASEVLPGVVTLHDCELWSVLGVEMVSLAISLHFWYLALSCGPDVCSDRPWLVLRDADRALDTHYLLTLCMHAQQYPSLPLVPSTDEEIKPNGCSSGFWSIFDCSSPLPGGTSTLLVICLQCLLRVQLLFQKALNYLCQETVWLKSIKSNGNKILQLMVGATRTLGKKGFRWRDFGWISQRNCWMMMVWSFVL